MKTFYAIVLVLSLIGFISNFKPSNPAWPGHESEEQILKDLSKWLTAQNQNSEVVKGIQEIVVFKWILFWRIISPESILLKQTQLVTLIDEETELQRLGEFTEKAQFVFEDCCVNYPKRNFLPVLSSECRSWFSQYPEQGVVLSLLTSHLLESMR